MPSLLDPRQQKSMLEELFSRRSTSPGSVPYREPLSASVASQQADVDAIRELASRQEEVPSQLDLSPLAALVDSWTGSKTSAGYRKPASSEDRMATIAKLRDMAAEGQKGISDTQAKLMMGADKADTSMMALLAKMAGGQNDQRRDNLTYRKERNLEKELTQLVDTKLNADMEQLNTIQTNLNSGKYIDLMNSLAQVSRQIAGEKGVLTDEDIKRTMPPNYQLSWAKLQHFFSGKSDADVPPEVAKGLARLVNVAKRRLVHTSEGHLNTKEKSYGAMSSYKDVFGSGTGQRLFDIRREKLSGLKDQLGENFKKPAELSNAEWEELDGPGRQKALDLIELSKQQKAKPVVK